MRFIGRVFIVLLVLSMGYVNAQTIRYEQIKGFKDHMFNVIDYGAKGDGVTDDTTAIKQALAKVPAAGGTVMIPAGRYKVTSTLIPKGNTTILGMGRELKRTVAGLDYPATTIEYQDASHNTPAIVVENNSFEMRDIALYGPRDVSGNSIATAGSIGIQIIGPTAGKYASSPILDNVSVTRFYDGIEITATDNVTLTNVDSGGNNNIGFKSVSSQGTWRKLNALGNFSHGFAFYRYPGSNLAAPSIQFMGTMSNGGCGVYSEINITGITDMFLQNDSLGELCLNTTGTAVAAILAGGNIQWSGWNTFSSRYVSGATATSPIEITMAPATGGYDTFPNPPAYRVTCAGITGIPAANGTFDYTYVSPTKITLNGTTGVGSFVASNGRCSPEVAGRLVTGATATTPIEITMAAAGTGQDTFPNPPTYQVTCEGITGVPEANGTFSYTYVSPTKITLNGTVGTGTFVATHGRCRKAGVATRPYASDYTAPGVAIWDGDGARISNVDIYGSFGSGIENLGDGTTLSNISTSGGFGLISPYSYALYSTGPRLKASAVTTDTPNYISGTQSVMVGNMFSGAQAIPSLKIEASNSVLCGNEIFHRSGGKALELTAAASVVPCSNQVYGTVTNASVGAGLAQWIGLDMTHAQLVASQVSLARCIDCGVTSTVDNHCTAGGAGALAFHDVATGWRCIQGTVAPGASATVNVRKADDSGSCTITFTSGQFVSTTCP